MNVPDGLRISGSELIRLSEDRTVSVAKTTPAFSKWYGPSVGETWADTFGNKTILDYLGEPVFAELYTLRVFEAAGWDGAWVNSFQKKFMVSYSPPVECAVPPEQRALLAKIAGSEAFPVGCWDVFAWRGDDSLFAECKLFPDSIRPSQCLWLEKALAVGVKVGSFLLVDWTRRDPANSSASDRAMEMSANSLKCGTLVQVCAQLSSNDSEKASALAMRDYPFVPLEKSGRNYSASDITRLLFRDGFIDRYTGDKLVFPAALRLLSILMPDEFPYDPHWKMDVTHPMFWELSPTVDHVVPAAKGGLDGETNWMSVSMLTNSSKSNWTLEQLGWTIRAPGDIKEWDGLVQWFVNYVVRHPTILNDCGFLRPWYVAARDCQSEEPEVPPT